MKIYVIIESTVFVQKVNGVFLNKYDAEEYIACCENLTIEEHEVIQ